MNSDVTLVNEIESAVEISAQLLDSKLPGWFNEIDLEHFDIQDPTKCVLSQLYEDYFEGMRRVRPAAGTLFFAHDEEPEGSELTNHAWRRAIEHRRAA